MSRGPTASVRRTLDRLEPREAPASVAAEVTYRPLDFQVTGTVQTTDVHPYTSAIGAATDTFSGNITLSGRVTYDANGGVSGTVNYASVGTGNSVYQTTSRSSANGTNTV